eukprot:3383991-Prymnesium_polylepis.2
MAAEQLPTRVGAFLGWLARRTARVRIARSLRGCARAHRVWTSRTRPCANAKKNRESARGRSPPGVVAGRD